MPVLSCRSKLDSYQLRTPYAKKHSHNSSTEVTEQRNQIEALAQINRDYTERYESLVKFLDGVNLDKSSESRRQSAPGSSSVVLPTSTLSSSRFAPSTPKRATSPNARHFDKIIGHLEHAITAIITAEQDLATQFSSYATYELTKLHSCHVASNEAKKALQDTGAYQPNKRPKTAMIMAQPSTTPIQSFSDQPRDPTHGSGLLSFYGISPKASNPTFHPRKAKHSIHPYESEIPRNYGQLQQQQDESCAAIPRRQSHQHSAAGASQAPTHPMYVLPMPQMRQQQQPQQQQQTIPQTYQMPPSFPLPQPQGMPAPPSPFPPPRFAAPPPPRQLGDTELSPALSEQSSGELLYLSAPSSNPPMPGESPSSEPPPSQRRSLASRSTRPTLGATARRKASSSDLHELFKHSSPQGALTTQPDDSSIMQLSLLEEQDKHRRLMEQDAASSEQRAPLNFEAMRPNSLAAAPLMRPPPPGGGMHAASGRPPRLGLAIPPSQMAPPQPGAPTDAQADRAKRLEESKRRVREARHAQFHSSLSSETVFPFPPTALPEMSYGHPTAATPQIPDARSSGAEVHSVHAPPFMYSPRAKSKLGPHDFVWFEGENDTCRATADPALNGAGNNGGGSADVVDELVRRWTTVAV